MRAKITLSKTALLANYEIIKRKVPYLKLLPMIKANAYGHGAQFVARTLMNEKQLHGFGVATFEEAISVRECLKSKALPILVFSDNAPWRVEQLNCCEKYGLQPVFSEIVSLLEFQKQKYSKTVQAHIEVNTGMNRLGIPVDSLSLVRFAPASILTHLAEADLPASKLTRTQITNFEKVVAWRNERYAHTLLHFANSSTIWNAKQFPLLKETNLARPGLSLYGVRPFEKAKEDGLKRVMTFSAPILNRIFLERGDQVGYGGTYICKSVRGEWIAVLGAGYADGVMRSLSQKGMAVYPQSKTKRVKVKFLGRVSMDLIAVQGTDEMKVGDYVTLWGNDIDPYVQANLAGTIPYELTTRVGERVERIYE